MIDVGKDLQGAYDYGYRQGVKDTLDDIHKTLERSLREKVSHLTEPNNCKTEKCSEKPNNCEPFDKDINVRSKDEPQTERPQGEWKPKNHHTDYCSNCGFEETQWRTADYNFCPSCGARMKGVDDEHTV